VKDDGGDGDLLVIRATPKEGRPIIWGHVIMRVRRSDFIPVRDEFYDENGELMRVMEYRDIKTFDGKRIPSVLELVPRNKEGHRTVITYEQARFDVDLEDEIFTLRNLRKRI
jgi:outer membrane lipoprotein-sorting protein